MLYGINHKQGEIYMVHIDYIDSLPLLPKEKEELKSAYIRSTSPYWVEAREVIKVLGEQRKEEKKQRAIARLLSDEPVNSIHPIPEVLKDYAAELRELGYSASAISKGFKGAISTSWCIERLDNPNIRPRGQVVELLDNFVEEFDLKEWALLGSYNTQHGPKLKKSEIEEIKSLYSQGWSIGRIAKKIHRSPSAVRRWVKK